MKNVFSTRGALALQRGINNAGAVGDNAQVQNPLSAPASTATANTKNPIWFFVVLGIVLFGAIAYTIYVGIKHKAGEAKYHIFFTLRNWFLMILMVIPGIVLFKLGFANLRVAWHNSNFAPIRWLSDNVIKYINHIVQLG